MNVDAALSEVECRLELYQFHGRASFERVEDAASVLAAEVRRLRVFIAELEKTHEAQTAHANAYSALDGRRQDYIARAHQARDRQDESYRSFGQMGAPQEGEVITKSGSATAAATSNGEQTL